MPNTLTIERITAENVDRVRELYEDFRAKATTDYEYGNPPVEFLLFIEDIQNKTLEGVAAFDGSVAAGILIYTLDKYGVIEINVIHPAEGQDETAVRFAILKELVARLKERQDWNVISYPMLGRQETFIRDIALLNFKFVGQSIVRFDFQSPIALRVFRNSVIPELGDYKLSIWNENYREEAIQLINNSFKNTKNTYFDPRFATYEGAAEVVEMIVSGQYGEFLPEHCRLLLLEGNLEGLCLAVKLTDSVVNVPLVAVKKNIRNKGMGKLLLKSVVGSFIRLIAENKISLTEINATADTDNYPAVRMYRAIGFKEVYFYAHAYLKRLTCPHTD